MIDLDNAILTKETFGEENKKVNPIHIAFGVDANFIRPMGVCMTSLVDNNKNHGLIFHIFANSIQPIDVER